MCPSHSYSLILSIYLSICLSINIYIYVYGPKYKYVYTYTVHTENYGPLTLQDSMPMSFALSHMWNSYVCWNFYMQRAKTEATSRPCSARVSTRQPSPPLLEGTGVQGT